MAITSQRYVYVGAHVTERTKDALREEAERQGCSMSLLVSLAIMEKLQACGHALETEAVVAEASDVA